MKRDILKYIKNDMWYTRHDKKDVQAMLKAELAELEARRKEELDDNAALDVSPESLAHFNWQTNERYDRRRQELIGRVIDRFHNDQMYHLIYKDGSEVVITAEEINHKQSEAGCFVNISVEPYRGKEYDQANTVVVVIG